MRGSCLCGAVSYVFSSQARSVMACHCTQCRKTSGHYVAATQVPKDSLEIQGADQLTWYHSSDIAKRAFCKTCGSQLFWTKHKSDTMTIMAGTLDGKTGLKMERQIWTEAKGDYYALPDLEALD